MGFGGRKPVTFSGDAVEQPLAEAAEKEVAAISQETRIKDEDVEGRRRRSGRAANLLSTGAGGRAGSGSSRSRTTLGI